MFGPPYVPCVFALSCVSLFVKPQGHGERVGATVHGARVQEARLLWVERRAAGPLSGTPAGGHGDHGESAMSAPGVHSRRGLQLRGTDKQDLVPVAQGENALPGR